MTNLLSALLLFLLCVKAMAAATSIFTYRAPESGKDAWYNYDTSVLALALEKNQDKYGEYTLEPSPKINFTRAMRSAQPNQYENFFFKQSYGDKLKQTDLSYIPFSVDLGIVGYRVCLLSDKIQSKVASTVTLDELRQLTHGQGVRWMDTAILENSGMMVMSIHSYESLFHLVAVNRFDLFCRGANELLAEHSAYKYIKGLVYDTSMSIAYPLD